MLTDKEKTGVHAILKKLSDHDIKSLAETITNRMVHFESNDEAIEAVLSYAESALDVLRRRKVKKEYICQYLLQVAGVAPVYGDKFLTVKAALTYWDTKDVQQLQLVAMEDDAMVCEDVEPSAQSGQSQSIQSSGSTQVDICQTGEVQEMALQFVRWFYPILNNGHLSNANAEDNFGPHHFWRDCQLKLHTPQYENLVEGSTAVSDKLLFLIGQHQLYFNPFDAQQGIRSFIEPHGLVVILVCGGLHHGDHCVGVYEQKFGLIRDPMAGNNWKIKFTELRISSKELDLSPEGCYVLEDS